MKRQPVTSLRIRHFKAIRDSGPAKLGLADFTVNYDTPLCRRSLDGQAKHRMGADSRQAPED